MLMNETTLQPGLYRLPDDPVGPRILIPGFQSAISVKGAFGWFSADWIARLSPGLAEYINRQNTQPIEFIVAPVFFPSERAAVEEAYCMPTDEATKRIRNVFVEGKVHASALGKHALECLSWMVATDFLRLKIAVPSSDSNYHPKMWLFDDGDHQVLARGSGNATGHGLSTGVEHLDVDVTWDENSRKRVKDGVAILEDWANGRSKGIYRVVSLPNALKEDIIKTAPQIKPTITDYVAAAMEDNNPSWAIDLSEKLRKRFLSSEKRNLPRLKIPDDIEWQSGLYEYQNEAVKAWESSSRPERGIISMATGAGKTIVALICATRAQERISEAPLLIVISAPSRPIVAQWVEEVRRFGVTAIAPSFLPNIEMSFTNLFRALSIGGTHVLIVSNKMLCSPKFQATLMEKLSSDVETMFIADEAHTLGAKGFIRNKPEFFERRLALSATPERKYDPDGTAEVFTFFGGTVYDFGLDRAIGFCLSPYNYYVHLSPLGGNELYDYIEVTRRIGAYIAKTQTNITKTDDETLTGLLIKRRSIIETAMVKTRLLRKLLEHRGLRSIQHSLIYVSAKNPSQFDSIAALLTDLNIRWAPVTQDTTANSKLLKETLQTFEKGGYQVLLAKRVLDEGVDIPSIREAFIVASSTVEREWIQRRGRVLRLHPGKSVAIVHDFLALPPPSYIQDESTKNIVLTELQRALAFAKYANNTAGPDGIFDNLEGIRNHYWSNGSIPFFAEERIDPATPIGRQ